MKKKNTKNPTALPSTSKGQTESTPQSSSENAVESARPSSQSAKTASTKTSTKGTRTKSRRTSSAPGGTPDPEAMATGLRRTVSVLRELGLVEVKIAQVVNLGGEPEPVAIRIVLPLDKWDTQMRLRDVS